MGTNTVNISFRKDLLEQIDKTAKEESRTRSELIREAARLYLEKKKRWSNIFNFGKNQALQFGLNQNDIESEIKKYRKKSRN